MTAAACLRRKPPKPPLPNYPRIISSSAAAAILQVLFFLIILLHHPLTTTADDVPDDEKTALILFRDKVKHHESYSWDESKPVCVDPPQEGQKQVAYNWKGVQCAGIKSVTHLSIPGASLVGEIPPDTIGKLVNLRMLTLRENGLSGSIPDDFSKLKGLTHLNLSYNKFSGHLTNLQLDKLRIFDVSSNYFTGELPNMKSENLEYFNVSSNYFTGNLPNIQSGDKLKYFNASDNKFTGPIPPSLANFDDSAFSKNIELCDDPLPACKRGTTYPPPAQPAESQSSEKTSDKSSKGLIVGVSVGSGLLLLVFLCCLGKKLSKQPPESPSHDLESASKADAAAAGTSTELGEGINKLVFLDAGIYSFDINDLIYKASHELLGKGSVGTSYKAVMNGGKTTVVVKKLENVGVTKEFFESRMQDLGKMKDQHLIPLRAYCYSEDKKWLVYDYMPDGILSAQLHNGSRGYGQTRLDWEQRIKIALSAARGVKYLHVVGKVVHGNIKSSNILLRQETNKDAYVSDYGLNTLFVGLSSENHHVTGYQAPEVLKTGEVTFESDVYSFGVLLLELLTGKDPNQTSLDKEGIESDQRPTMVHLLQIAKKCVLFEPDQRPTMNEVVRMMEDMNRVEMDDWLRQSSDDHSKPFDDTPSTETRGTPSTITP